VTAPEPGKLSEFAGVLLFPQIKKISIHLLVFLR
tara:strand:- start:1470 stop:1571 length:102 start_codon:yes stop_codon:yes gene_type:complete